MTKTIIFHIIILVLCFAQFAQAATSCGSSIEPVIVHINGINTTLAEAKANMDLLEEATTSNQLPNKVILAYNWSYSQWNPAIGQILDSIDAAVQVTVGKTQTGITNLFSTTVKLVFFWDTSGISTQALETLQPALNAVISMAMRLIDIKPGATQNILADIDKATTPETPLLLVPHSQGCMYANYIYTQLDRVTRPVRIVAVASPASFVAGNGTYVNSKNDIVVTFLHLPLTLSANETIPETTADPMGHSFSKVYLDPVLSKGRTAILEKIHTAISTLATNTNGGIPITLSWTDSAILTLWVQDGGVNYPVIGTNGSATYTICDPVNSTMYPAFASTNSTWPTTATITTDGKTIPVDLSSTNTLDLGNNINVKLAGTVFVNYTGVVDIQ